MISKGILEDIFHIALSTGADFAEVFMEDNFSTQITTIGGTLEQGMSGRDYGLGLRLLKGLDSVYVYTNDLAPESLRKAARKAAGAMRGQERQIILNLDRKEVRSAHPFCKPPGDVDLKVKLELAKRATAAGRAYHEEIGQVTVSYLDQDQAVTIANTDGLFAEDRRVRTRMLIQAVAEGEGTLSESWTGPGAMKGLEFYDEIQVEEFAREAARGAQTMLHAEYCPAGVMPVVVDNGFGGLMFHEACGHSLEASSVAKGTSVFAGMQGQKIASDLVTLVDDGSITNAWGSLGMDDEGAPTRKNTLIEKGILNHYMVDRLNGRRMGQASTGSARRQSYRFAPTSRMFNTYIAAGSSSQKAIIEATERGLFASRINAGSVNPTTGEFNFSLSEAWLIEDGRITRPVKGATLIGNGRDILKDVDMVGDNLKIEEGYCFASSGALFIGAGQPTLRVSSMTVGGRSGV